MNVLFIAPYPKNIGPSQRFRFEHYLPFLKKEGINYSYNTFINRDDYRFFHAKGAYFKKASIVLKGFLNRLLLLFNLKDFDFVYIHREAAPVGPPVFEWFIAKILGKRIIYDFDDSIWVYQASEANPFAAKIKCTWKVAKICSWSWKVSVGNQFLANYAKQYNSNVVIVPTVVNTENKHNMTKDQNLDIIKTIGWTGTFTNFVNFKLMLPALRKLKKEENFKILIIADRDPMIFDLQYEFLKWNIDTEIEDLIRMNVGLMPLLNEEVQLGKCAFKAIQYMALGIPAVVSPVGSNCEVVNNGVDGFWANSDDNWYVSLKRLLSDNALRESFGENARKKINENYSVKSSLPIFISLFKNTAHTN